MRAYPPVFWQRMPLQLGQQLLLPEWLELLF